MSELVKSKHIDILAITETWLKPDDTKACVADVTPSGYHVHHQTRHSKGTRTGGGVGILISVIFRSKQLEIPRYSSFEAISCEIKDLKNTYCFRVICIYRTGPLADFFNDFKYLLENASSHSSETFILGDFNMHLDIPSSNTKPFKNILESFYYLLHVNFPTHIHGHWLDLFISRCNQSSDIIDKKFSSDGLSDHFMVIAELNFQINQHPKKEKISFRKILILRLLTMTS